jgi:glycosyltransferase involved in cell wall biosynthesis
MRIAFDGTTLTPGRTGVGYYSEHLLHHLAAQGDDEVVVLSNRPIETTRPLPPRTLVAPATVPLPRLVWLQAVAPRLLRRLRPDVVHFTNGMMPFASPVPTVVTIHDMSLTMYPRYHPLRRVLLNRPLVDVAARRADAIITVSQSAKRDIMRIYGTDAGRIHVVHEAAAPSFRPVRDASTLERIRRRYGLADRFILYVGTIEPRKNLPKLIAAFAERHKAGDLPHQLVCAGPYGWLSRDIEELIARLEIEDALRFTGYVPFADLPALYSLAEIFVFPSIYEGFGLPVVEAMACGTPVVTGHVAALAEVAGGAVEHVERLETDQLGEVFSWERAARETLNVYRHALSGEAPAPAQVRAAWHGWTP